jgi:RNA polymerase sigma-70 factor (ECF subfamily)
MKLGELDPDATDVAGARQGSLTAQERLYRRHYTKLLRLASLAGYADDAEDIVHETFLQAFRKIDSFRQEAHFAAWLCRICINRARSTRRSKNRREQLDTDLAAGRPISALDETELRLSLQRAIAVLPDAQKTALLCHDMLGMSHRETAYVLGCAEGTSKVHLHRGRLRVRELLLAGGTP